MGSGAAPVTLVAAAGGNQVTLGPETSDQVSAYMGVPVVGNMATFSAKGGSTLLATIQGPVSSTLTETVADTTRVGSDPVLSVFPDESRVNPTGQLTLWVINLSKNFGGALDLYLTDADGVIDFDQIPIIPNIGLFAESRSGEITASVTFRYLAIAQLNKKTTVYMVPLPDNTFTASGNFAI